PRGESPGERVQAVVQVETDDVVFVAQDEAQTDAGRRSGSVLVRAPRPRVGARRSHAGRRQRDLLRVASDPPVAGRQLDGERVACSRTRECLAAPGRTRLGVGASHDRHRSVAVLAGPSHEAILRAAGHTFNPLTCADSREGVTEALYARLPFGGPDQSRRPAFGPPAGSCGRLARIPQTRTDSGNQ